MQAGTHRSGRVLPGVQKVQNHVEVVAARVEEVQVPAREDAVQTAKHVLHQPGEDEVQLLQKHATITTCMKESGVRLNVQL